MAEATTSERIALSSQDRDCVALSIDGMTCGSCANAVQRALSRVLGVISAEVDLVAGWARVQGSARPEDLLAAVEMAGYRAALGQSDVAEKTPKSGGCGCGC